MQRSGGQAGRPFGHVGIETLEKQVRVARGDRSELLLIYAELGHRETKRAGILKSLVQRLLSEDCPREDGPAGPIFDKSLPNENLDV